MANRSIKIPGMDERIEWLVHEKYQDNVTAFCEACGICKSHFYQRNGQTLRMVYRIVGTTHCRLDWLFYGKGEPFE